MNNVAVVAMEILVTGVTASIWIALIMVRILFPASEVQQRLIELINSLSMGNLLIASIMMYNIGWVVHHFSERTIDNWFQIRYRRKLYPDNEFYKIRAVVFQYGSQSTMDDIKFARHVLRISRSNVINFGILTLVSLWYIPINGKVFIIAAVGACLATALSVLQWVSRYKSTYQMFRQIYDAIVEHNAEKIKQVESSVHEGDSQKRKQQQKRRNRDGGRS